jgi:O-antigen/teichoic acid export membrane protein
VLLIKSLVQSNHTMAKLKRLSPVFDQAIISAFNFLLTIALVSSMPLPDFGEVAYISTVILIGQGIVGAAIILPMNIYAPLHTAELAKYSSATLAITAGISVCMSLCCWPVLILMATGRNYMSEFLTLAVGAAFVSISIQDCARRQLYLKAKNALGSAVVMLRYGGPVAMIAGMHLLGVSLSPLKYWLIVISACLVSLLVQFWYDRLKVFSADLMKRALIEFWEQGAWLVGQTTVQLISDNLLFLISGLVLPKLELGIWRSLQSVSGLLNPALVSLENIVPAAASRQRAQYGPERANQWLLSVATISIFLFSVLCGFVALFAKDLTEILFPKVPRGWDWIVQAYAAILLLSAVKYFLVVHARLHHLGRSILLASICCLVFSFLTAWPLVERFGLPGAIWGTLGMQFVNIAAILMFFRKTNARNGALKGGL